MCRKCRKNRFENVAKFLNGIQNRLCQQSENVKFVGRRAWKKWKRVRDFYFKMIIARLTRRKIIFHSANVRVREKKKDTLQIKFRKFAFFVVSPRIPKESIGFDDSSKLEDALSNVNSAWIIDNRVSVWVWICVCVVCITCTSVG